MGWSVGAGTTVILPSELLTVRRTPFVQRVEVAVQRAARIFASELFTVWSTVGVEWVDVAVRGTAWVLPRPRATVGWAALVKWVVFAVAVKSLGFTTPTVNFRSVLIPAVYKGAEDLRTLEERLSCGFILCVRLRCCLIISVRLTKGLISFLKHLIRTFLVTSPFTYFYLTGGEDIKDIRKLESLKIAVSHNVGSALVIRDPPGEESLQQLVLHDTTQLIRQLEADCVAAVVVFTGVCKTLLYMHVIHVLIVLGIDQHGQRLTNLDGRVHLLGVWVTPHLQVHPAVHRISLKLHFLKVQHLHLKRLKLDPLPDEVGPLTVDLPGAVPHLLHFFVHLDDDDVAEACLQLCFIFSVTRIWL